MTNQSSCRSNQPGCSGYGRQMPGQGRPAPGRSMNAPGRINRPAPGCPVKEPRTVSGGSDCGRRQENHCDHSDRSGVVCVKTENFPVGMAYVPMQTWGPIYEPGKALCQGTLFPDLDKPFLGGRPAR